MNQLIDTRKSSGWRKLRFETIDDCIAEVNRILMADNEGRLSNTGNWTAGQSLSHLAAWVNYAYDGFPMRPVPSFVRWFLRLRLEKMLSQGMPRGVKIPGVKGGTTGMESLETKDAVKRYLGALERLRSSEVARFDSPAFGALSHDDRIRLNLRHAELHLGYMSY